MEQDLTIPEGYDARAVNLARAIRTRESKGDYNAVGDAGTSHGAYQWQKDTWSSHANEAGLDANDFSPKNQDNVAYHVIKNRIDRGMSLPEIAAEWNSGSSKGWENKVGDTVINGKKLHYDVPAYVNAVNDYYQDIKEKSSGHGLPQDSQGLQTADTAGSTNTVPEQSGLLARIGQGLAKPFDRIGGSLLQKIHDVTGLGSNQTDQNGQMTGLLGNKVDSLGYRNGQKLDTLGTTLDTTGAVAEGLSNFVGGGVARNVGKGILSKTLAHAVPLVKQGALTGGLAAGGNSLQNGDGALDTAIKTGEGLVGGAITAPVLGLGLPGAVKGYGTLRNALDNSPKNVSKNILEGLTKVEDYPAMRDAAVQANAKGIDPKKIISQTDLLRGAVDENGTIHTIGDGMAHDQYQKFIRPAESVVSDILKKEGRSIPLSDVETQLRNAVDHSKLEGAALDRAHAEVDAEIKGLARRADKNGKISLDRIHSAKVNKYATINYTVPESKIGGKVIAKALKNIVEKETKSLDVKNVNKELSKHYAMLKYLEKLDGKKVEGGRLGKYTSQIIGGMVGSHAGPLGTIAGSEAARFFHGLNMSGKLGGKGIVGKGLEHSDLMKQAIANSKSPRLALPAPKPQAPKIQSTGGKVIPLTKETPSTISKREGILGKKYQKTYVPEKKTLALPKPSSVIKSSNYVPVAVKPTKEVDISRGFPKKWILDKSNLKKKN